MTANPTMVAGGVLADVSNFSIRLSSRGPAYHLYRKWVSGKL